MTTVQYSNAVCEIGSVTAFLKPEDGSALLQQSQDCALNLNVAVDSTSILVSRIISIASTAVFTGIAIYRLNQFKLQNVTSTPFLAYLYLTLFDFAMILTFTDPVNATGLFPEYFVFFYTWIVYVCMYSMLVIVVYNILYSVFVEFSKADKDYWMKPFYSKMLFGQIVVVSFVTLIPNKVQDFKAFQVVLSILEIILLGVFGIWYGFKLLNNIVKHQKETQQNYARAILKIRTLLAATVSSVCFALVIFGMRAVEIFKGISPDNLLSESELQFFYWKSFLYVFFITIVSNCLGFVTFKSASRSITGHSTAQKPPASTGNKPTIAASSQHLPEAAAESQRKFSSEDEKPSGGAPESV